MTWPTVAITTTNLDAGADSPATARADLLDAATKVNQMIAHVSTFAATLLDDTTAAAARTTLGAAATGTLAASGITGAAASGANTDITSMTALTSINAGQIGGMRNRVLNGDMRINQERALSATVTVNGAGPFYALDGWCGVGVAAAGVFTLAQWTDGPTGELPYSMLATVTTADAALAAGDAYFIRGVIEGSDIQDFRLGSGGAKTITVSFWVKSTMTGAHSGALANSAGNRGYPFSFAISVASTWEYKTVTIVCDTSGTWLDTVGSTGLRISFSLGCGTTYTGTSSSWQAINALGVTGAASLMASATAAMNITGVQVEIGSVATEFETIPTGVALGLCRRRWRSTYDYGVTPATVSSSGTYGAMATAAGAALINIPLDPPMRATPTVTVYNASSGATGTWRDGGASDRAVTTLATGNGNILLTCSTVAASSTINGHVVLDARI